MFTYAFTKFYFITKTKEVIIWGPKSSQYLYCSWINTSLFLSYQPAVALEFCEPEAAAFQNFGSILSDQAFCVLLW